MKLINQGPNDWYKSELNGSLDIENVEISDGGLLSINGVPNPHDVVTLKNVFNKASTGGSKYFVMCWPQRPDGVQCAIPKLVWDNSGISNVVQQGPNEAAFRGKIDDAHIIGVKFKAFIKDGSPWKQVLQVRHGRQWVFTKCEFIDGWCDIGQQKTAQPDGSSHYETSQHVGTVIFDGCTFHKMPGQNSYVAREPGVDKVEFINCFDPSGHKFSKTI